MLVWTFACTPRPAPLAIDAVSVDFASWTSERPQLHDEVRQRVTARLRHDRTVQLHVGADGAPVAPGEAASTVHLQVVEAAPTPTLRVTLERRGGDEALQADVNLVATTVQDIDAAFASAWDIVARLRAVREADDAQLLVRLRRGLDHGDAAAAQVHAFVLAQAGARRLRAAVPLLCRHLEPAVLPPLQRQAIAALVAIGDGRAVVPLIDMGRRRDANTVLPLLFAVAALGGRTAEGYLRTMVGGHPDPAVRAAAAEALGQLLQRPRAGRAPSVQTKAAA